MNLNEKREKKFWKSLEYINRKGRRERKEIQKHKTYLMLFSHYDNLRQLGTKYEKT